MADVVKKATNKKKSRRLKRSVRRTLGTLFLVSALVVAAVPTDGLQAAPEDSVTPRVSKSFDSTTLKWTAAKSQIPLVRQSNEYIFEDANGLFRFAWQENIAIILGYAGGTIPGGALTIPATVDAYAKYQPNDADGNPVAVSRSREPLYYMSEERKVATKHDVTSTAPDGTPTITEVIDSYTRPAFLPCLRNDTNWDRGAILETYYFYRYSGSKDDYLKNQTDGVLVTEETLDINATNASNAFLGQDGNVYIRTRAGDHQWIRGQKVEHLGNQYLEKIENPVAEPGKVVRDWKIADACATKANEDPTKGIFAGQSNIDSLTVGSDLVGIGNYAFYGCANLKTVKFGNGLVEVGKSAFENCANMYGVGFDFGSRLSYISDRAFAGCTNLQSFVLPVGVNEIYDQAFEGCIGLTSLDLTGETQPPYKNDKGEDVQPVTILNKIGCSVFRNCSALTEIRFPMSMENAQIHLDNFDGCSALEHITVLSDKTDFVPHAGSSSADSFTVDDFLAGVMESIYFEANNKAQAHIFTTENSIAFKYRDDRKQYEKIIKAPNNVKLTYQADDNNNLIYFAMSGPVDEVEIPVKIGPRSISALGARSFVNTCDLQKLIIPATVSSIGAEAFMGCHNLKHVIFNDAGAIQSIGADAFHTQEMYIAEGGSHSKGDSFDQNVSLTFTGAIATDGGAGRITVPFAYAMNMDRDGADNRISNDNQTPTYITYYSGWPSLLEVKYNRETGKSQLENYPSITDLQSKYGTVDSYPFMNKEYVEAVTTALKVYYGGSGGNGDPVDETVTGYAEALHTAVQNIVLPRGIESIKPGLFVDKEKADSATHPDKLKTLTAYGLKKVDDGAFQGFQTLSSVNLADSTTQMGSYVFDGCTKLSSATLPMTLEEIGMRPFKGCESLTNVAFSGNPRFTVVDDIIYETENGNNSNKIAVVECLEKRVKSVTKAELAGVQALYREAFMDAKVQSVDLSSSYIKSVPEFAFAYTPKLFSVTLPGTVVDIKANAFKNSTIAELTVPGTNTQFDDLALGDDIYRDDGETAAKDFWMTTHAYKTPEEAKAAGVGAWTGEDVYGWSHTVGSSKDATLENIVLIYCEEDSWAKIFADRKNIETSNDFDKTYVVNFYDEDGVTKLADTQTVRRNEAANAPDMTGRTNSSGQVFIKWVSVPSADPDCIVADTDFRADYGDPTVELCTITFWKDYTQTESFGTAQVVKGTTKTQLEASGQIPTERVNAYATSISRKFLAWVNLPDVINEDANPYAQYDLLKWTVTFVAYDDPALVFGTQSIPDGDDAQDFKPQREGYVFQSWLEDLKNIKEDKTIRGLFLPSSQTVTHTVTYYEEDGVTVFRTLSVADGGDAPEIEGPKKEGYTFNEWRPAANLKNVTKDVSVMASFTAGSGGSGNDGNGGNGSNNNNNNNNNNTNNGNNGTTSSNTTSGNTASGNGSTGYILTVQNGSGSGSYPAGSQPVIIANNPASGYEFSHWTISPANTPIASTVLSASVITMPASNVTVTANYKVKSGSSTGTGNSSVNNSNRPNGTTGTVTNGGTTVVIDKNGLSNTGVVSAVVNGSSDNFTIKITESSAATEAVLRALVAEYGNDLSNIKYFPMDISLYDSTGTTKITDTTGLRISITLPLPDSLIPYAGNNKVAGVVNDRLDKLSPRFTTIDGVSCVTFTAEHFSPYVIYVDTSRLSDGTVADSTPKTGDGIHPKWFLSIGLACLSFVMFMQKDNKKKEKVKVKARA